MFPNMNQVLKIVYPRGQFFPSSAGWVPRLYHIFNLEGYLDGDPLGFYSIYLTTLRPFRGPIREMVFKAIICYDTNTILIHFGQDNFVV